MATGFEALTEKEKETLRLMVRGHDAKSMARELCLSVHTINDRLRAARRKLEVTSSREAARIALEHEALEAGVDTPQMLAGKEIGSDLLPANREGAVADQGKRLWHTKPFLIGGLVMSLILAATLLAMQASAPPSPATGMAEPTAAPEAPASDAALGDARIESTARQWLALVDAENWEASYAAASSTFRGLNTPENWAEASRQARVPLGKVLSREAVSFANVPAPENGLQMVRFKTVFEGKADAVETVTVERDGDELRVVGYYID